MIMGDSNESSDIMGIVTVHDGMPLEEGEIIAPSVGEGHASFQDPENFSRLAGVAASRFKC